MSKGHFDHGMTVLDGSPDPPALLGQRDVVITLAGRPAKGEHVGRVASSRIEIATGVEITFPQIFPMTSNREESTRAPGLNTEKDASPAVAWRGVRKEYPGSPVALSGVSLEVARGEFLAILGTSGSGKTTLLKMVNRLIEPTSGEVLVHGRPTSQWDPIALRRSIGYVIQDVGLMPHLTILANVGLVPRLSGVPRQECDDRARARLELVGLDPERFGRQMPHQLSGGQRQRVGVARALAADPELILMDEPFGALDPISRRELQDEFRSLQQRLRMTVVFVTHDIREAYRIADRLALMDHGSLIQAGRPSEFRKHPATDFVRSFFLDAEAVQAAGEEERA